MPSPDHPTSLTQFLIAANCHRKPERLHGCRSRPLSIGTPPTSRCRLPVPSSYRRLVRIDTARGIACWRCRHGRARPGRAAFTTRRASQPRPSPPREVGSVARCCHADRSFSRKHGSVVTSPALARRDVIWARSGCEHVSMVASTVVNLLKRRTHTSPGAAVGPRGGAALSCAPSFQTGIRRRGVGGASSAGRNAYPTCQRDRDGHRFDSAPQWSPTDLTAPIRDTPQGARVCQTSARCGFVGNGAGVRH